jgi:hypothetical protein
MNATDMASIVVGCGRDGGDRARLCRLAEMGLVAQARHADLSRGIRREPGNMRRHHRDVSETLNNSSLAKAAHPLLGRKRDLSAGAGAALASLGVGEKVARFGNAPLCPPWAANASGFRGGNCGSSRMLIP